MIKNQSSAEVDGLLSEEEVSPSSISPAEEEAGAEGTSMPEEVCLGEDETGVASGFVEGVVGVLEGGLVNDQPLPNLAKGTGEVQVLIEQQQADVTLAGLRKCAEKGEDGYSKKGGVLVHKKGSELGKKWLRVVVPSFRRQQILDLAHRY